MLVAILVFWIVGIPTLVVYAAKLGAQRRAALLSQRERDPDWSALRALDERARAERF